MFSAVKRGDMVFVDAGTVHAIWPGSILLETQQNSDITYRMYDYGRPRELHVDKSLEAMRFETRAGLVQPRIEQDRTILIDVEYFRVERIAVKGTRESASLPGNRRISAAGCPTCLRPTGLHDFRAADSMPFNCRRAELPQYPQRRQRLLWKTSGGST